MADSIEGAYSNVDDEEISAMWDWEVTFPSSIVSPLYYYRSRQATERILDGDKIRLRLLNC